MTTRISKRDWEALSAYMDGQLSPREHARLASRLEADPELQSALQDLRRTRAMLRSLPKLRAPRNYTLTPEMVTAQQDRSRAYPVLSLASALATFLLVLVLVGDFFAPRPIAMAPVMETQVVEAPAQAVPGVPSPQFGMGGGEPGTEVEESERAVDIAPAPTSTIQASPEAGAYPAQEAPAEEPSVEMMEEAAPSPPARAGEQVESYPAPDRAGEQVEAYPVPDRAADQILSTPEAEIVPIAAIGGDLIFRILEVSLGIIAIVTGLAAFLVRRASGS